MNRQKVLRTFEKVDPRFSRQMGTTEQGEAIEEFRRLWVEQKGKVSRVVDKREKVQNNRQEQAAQLQGHASKIAADLSKRMEKHTKKRSVLQLQKLKNYKNMDRNWKEKVMQISIKVRTEKKQQFEKAKELSKEIQQFWENKRSLKSQSSKLSYHQSQEFSPRSQHNHKQTEFLTEVNFSPDRRSSKRNAKSVLSSNGLPLMEPSQRLKSEVAVSRSVNVHRHKTQMVDPHILKSRLGRQQRQDSCFQRAMEKIDVILKKRIKAKQKLQQSSRQVKETRLEKQNLFKQKKQHRSQRERHVSLHQQRHKSFQEKQGTRISTALRPYYNPRIELRRKQLQQENSRLREEMFSMQKFRERRGKFHRMVRDAVNIFRLQALRHKG